MNHFVIIGDLVQSREIRDRDTVQKRFAATLGRVQQEFEEDIASPFTLTIGDEFQAVLDRCGNLYAMIHSIESGLNGLNLRYGLGLGGIETDINPAQSIGMDGPAFHRARRALEEAKKSGRRFCIETGLKLPDQRLNTLLDWIDVTSSRWNREKRDILFYWQQKHTQKEIAARTGISQPAVSQHINNQLFRLVWRTQELIQRELDAILEGNHDR